MNEKKILKIPKCVPIMPCPINSLEQLLLLVRLVVAQMTYEMIYENIPLGYWVEYELRRRIDYYSIGDVYIFKIQTDLSKRLELIEIKFSNQECKAILSWNMETGEVNIVRIKTDKYEE